VGAVEPGGLVEEGEGKAFVLLGLVEDSTSKRRAVGGVAVPVGAG